MKKYNGLVPSNFGVVLAVFVWLGYALTPSLAIAAAADGQPSLQRLIDGARREGQLDLEVTRDPNSPIGLTFFEDLTPMRQVLYVVRKGARHPHAAKLFALWATTAVFREQTCSVSAWVVLSLLKVLDFIRATL